MAKRKKIDPVSEVVQSVDSGENTTLPGFDLVPVDAVIIDTLASSDLTLSEAVEARFIGAEHPQTQDIHAEQIVDSLIDAQVGIDSQESSAIVSMIDAVRSGSATVKAFVECFAVRAVYRMSARSVPIRKSNLKGVLSLALEDVEYAAIVTDERLGLQAAYALRLERKKPKAVESAVTVADDTDDADEAPESYTDAMGVLCQQIRNAIEAAEKASRGDIADDLRAVLEKAFGAIEA